MRSKNGGGGGETVLENLCLVPYVLEWGDWACAALPLTHFKGSQCNCHVLKLLWTSLLPSRQKSVSVWPNWFLSCGTVYRLFLHPIDFIHPITFLFVILASKSRSSGCFILFVLLSSLWLRRCCFWGFFCTLYHLHLSKDACAIWVPTRGHFWRFVQSQQACNFYINPNTAF